MGAIELDIDATSFIKSNGEYRFDASGDAAFSLFGVAGADGNFDVSVRHNSFTGDFDGNGFIGPLSGNASGSLSEDQCLDLEVTGQLTIPTWTGPRTISKTEPCKA